MKTFKWKWVGSESGGVCFVKLNNLEEFIGDVKRFAFVERWIYET